MLIWSYWAWTAGPDDAGCQRIANYGEREGWSVGGSDGTQMDQMDQIDQVGAWKPPLGSGTRIPSHTHNP